MKTQKGKPQILSVTPCKRSPGQPQEGKEISGGRTGQEAETLASNCKANGPGQKQGRIIVEKRCFLGHNLSLLSLCGLEHPNWQKLALNQQSKFFPIHGSGPQNLKK